MMRKTHENLSGEHTQKVPRTARVGWPHRSRPWVKTCPQVLKPLSLKQESPERGGEPGALGSRGPAVGRGPRPAVGGLACCVLCCWRLPALPGPACLPPSPLSPSLCPRWMHGSVLVPWASEALGTEWCLCPRAPQDCGVSLCPSPGPHPPGPPEPPPTPHLCLIAEFATADASRQPPAGLHPAGPFLSGCSRDQDGCTQGDPLNGPYRLQFLRTLKPQGGGVEPLSWPPGRKTHSPSAEPGQVLPYPADVQHKPSACSWFPPLHRCPNKPHGGTAGQVQEWPVPRPGGLGGHNRHSGPVSRGASSLTWRLPELHRPHRGRTMPGQRADRPLPHP